MGNHFAITSVAQSLLMFLQQSHATSPVTLPASSFQVLSSTKFGSEDVLADPTLTLYLHRITVNNHLRNTRSSAPVGPLGLDLNFLLTVWSDAADVEHTLMGWAMRELHYHAFLDASSLTKEAAWAADEALSLIPADLSPEEMARIWEAARRGYRLSYPFITRVVRLELPKPQGPPVVASRFTFSDDLAEVVP